MIFYDESFSAAKRGSIARTRDQMKGAMVDFGDQIDPYCDMKIIDQISSAINVCAVIINDGGGNLILRFPPWQGTRVLDGEDNVLELEDETIVVGDLHGQFFDLLNILETYGQVICNFLGLSNCGGRPYPNLGGVWYYCCQVKKLCVIPGNVLILLAVQHGSFFCFHVAKGEGSPRNSSIVATISLG